MDTLRWILLALGLLAVAGLYGYYRWQEGSPLIGKNRHERRGGHDVDLALRDLDDLVIDDPDAAHDADLDQGLSARSEVEDTAPGWSWDAGDEGVSAPRVRPAAGQAREPREPGVLGESWEDRADRASRASRASREVPGPEQRVVHHRGSAEDDLISDSLEADPAWQDAGEKIVVLHVSAGKGYLFTGPPLVDALERMGLRHGMHDIYHWNAAAQSGDTPLFSVANMVEPGHFDLKRVDDMETPGVAMFMQLPGPFDGLTAFEQMLEVARRLADELDGQLLDGKRCDLTTQAIEHLREELREYRRKARVAASRSRV